RLRAEQDRRRGAVPRGPGARPRRDHSPADEPLRPGHDRYLRPPLRLGPPGKERLPPGRRLQPRPDGERLGRGGRLPPCRGGARGPRLGAGLVQRGDDKRRIRLVLSLLGDPSAAARPRPAAAERPVVMRIAPYAALATRALEANFRRPSHPYKLTFCLTFWCN